MSGNATKKRGVIYKRVSGDGQQKNGYSLPSQDRLVRDKMIQDGVVEVHEPIEDVESGRNFERKGLKILLELAYARLIDYVYVYDLDRLGRHVAETPYLMYTLKENGVIVRDIKEEYNFDDPIEYVMVTMKCLPGHTESLKIGERTQRGKNEKFKQGKWVGPVPFGYRENADGFLEKRPELEPIAHDFFQTYADTGDYKRATQVINEKYSDKIGRITINKFKTIVNNPVSIGRPRYGKTQIDAPHLAIISKDLWDRVQRLSEAKAKRHKPKEKRKPHSILDHFASEYGPDYVMSVLKLLRPVCPKCGSLMVGDGSKPYDEIRLPNFKCNNNKCGYQRTIPLISELELFRRDLMRCPKCGAVEDFVKTATLGGSIEYTCRRCGTSFQFTAKKESKKTNESLSNPKSEDHTKPEQLPTVKDRTNHIDLPNHPIKALPEDEEKKTDEARFKMGESSRKEQQANKRKNQTLEDFWSKSDKADI
ncbi:MAG: recombinase family protein [Candidatus Bathyarchaeia archaeon]